MAEPFIGEIRYVGFTFAPLGWAVCAGQLMSIDQNTALFSLLGTTFGGDGQTTFALPDLQGRILLGQGQGPGLPAVVLGEQGGENSVTLTVGAIPAHTHGVSATSQRANDPGNDPRTGVFADPFGNAVGRELYGATPDSIASRGAAQPTGGSQPHENRQPYTCILPIIALEGIYPSRS